MNQMLYKAQNFNQNIAHWNVTQVTSMDQIFEDASQFYQNISGWCVKKLFEVPQNWKLNSAIRTNSKFFPTWTCPPGQFKNGCLCAEFPPGTCRPSSGINKCYACPSGSYQPESGKSTCMDCPHYSICDSLSYTCPAGRYHYISPFAAPSMNTHFFSGGASISYGPSNVYCKFCE